jgi:hypothetical protein
MRRVIMLGLIVACLVLAGVSRAQPGVPEPAPPHRVEGCAASGGQYRLAAMAWQIQGTVGGGGYRLDAPAAPLLRGSGCCCTYLPLVVRSYWP